HPAPPPQARYARSDSFDDAFAEHAVRANHERENHEDVGRKVLGAAADVGIDVPGGDVLDNADDEAADDRAGDRVEPAEDHDRKHLEADQRQVHVDAGEVSPDDAA